MNCPANFAYEKRYRMHSFAQKWWHSSTETYVCCVTGALVWWLSQVLHLLPPQYWNEYYWILLYYWNTGTQTDGSRLNWKFLFQNWNSKLEEYQMFYNHKQASVRRHLTSFFVSFYFLWLVCTFFVPFWHNRHTGPSCLDSCACWYTLRLKHLMP